MDAPWARERVEAAQVARLGTVDDAGRPRLVPCTFVLDGETLYSAVDAKPKRTTELARLRDVAARPSAVTVLVDHYSDDWSALWWVRLRGAGRVLRDGPERERALDLLAAKYPQYRDDGRPDGPVLALDVREWRSWQAAPA